MKTIVLILCALVLNACSLYTPQSTTMTKNPAAAEINASLGLAYLSQKDVARGKQKILLAQQQAPNDPVVWYATGYFLENTQDLIAAEKAYHRAIELSPHSGAAQNNYGVFLCRQGKYRAAIAHFLLAIQDPNYLHVAEVYKNAGRCASLIPDTRLAQTYFKLAAARDPILSEPPLPGA